MTTRESVEQPTKACMGQRMAAYVGRQNNNGSVTAIYVHHNGSLADTGCILGRFYEDREDSDSLMALGNLGFLGATKETSEAYGRDHDLDGEEAVTYRNATAFERAAQVYARRYGEHCHAYLQRRSGEWHIAWGYGKNGSIRWLGLEKFLKRSIWTGL